MKMCKRGMAWLLSVLMLTMAIPFGGITVSATEPLPPDDDSGSVMPVQELQLGVAATAVIEEVYGRAAFLFIPEESGTYRFYSTGKYDTYVSLYEVYPGWDNHFMSNDDSGREQNFLLDVPLTAGQPYRYEVGLNGDGTGFFPVMLEMTGTTTCDAELLVGVETVAYFGERAGEKATFLFTPKVDGKYDFAVDQFISGGVKSLDGGVYLSREEFDHNTRIQHFYCDLTGGTTYRLELYYNDYMSKGSASVLVKKLQAYTSIEFHDLTLREGVDAIGLSYDTDDNGQKRYYSLYGYTPCFTVTWEDGTKTLVKGSSFYSSAGRHEFYMQDTQGAKNPWKAGRLNQATATMYGDNNAYTFAVTLTENPVLSVSVADRTYIEHTNGYYRTNDVYDENGAYQGQVTYYNYHCTPEDDDYVVTMKDGSVFYGTSFVWKGEEYRLPNLLADQQSHENPLTLGTNQLQAWCAGLFVDYNVHIVETPVASVSVNPLYVIEEEHGYFTTDHLYDESGNYLGQSPEYFYYYALSYGVAPESCVITLKDGTVIHDNWFEYEGCSYQAEITYEQNYNNRLLYGTNYVSAMVGGYTFDHAVEVTDTPVVSVEITCPQRLNEQDGYFTTSSLYDENNIYVGESPEYFHYYADYLDGAECVITLKDGTVIHDRYFNWNGLSGQVECYQNYDTRLLLGVNVITATIANFEFTFEIEVIDTVVASVEIPRLVLREGVDGTYERDDLYDDYGNYLGKSPEYFRYYADFLQGDRCVITLEDGTVINGTYFEWGGEGYTITHKPQSYESRLVLGVNLVPATICGYEFTIEVEVLETPVASVEVQTPSRIEHANGSWTSTDMWDDYGNYLGRSPEFFHYDSILPKSDAVTITMKDGTVIHGTDFEWEGGWYNVSTSYEQTYDNRLLKGSNTVYASVLGYTFYYEIEIVDSPVVKVEADAVRLVENREGYYTTSSLYDEDGFWIGESPTYFYYYADRPDNLRIHLADGTVIEGGSFEWDGEWYSAQYPQQSYDNRLVPGRNLRTAVIAGYEFTYVIDVVGTGSNECFSYQISADGVIITGCHQYSETLEIPAEIDGMPVIEVSHLGWSDEVKHIVFPDSVCVMTTELGSFANVESIVFGSGIGGLHAAMFDGLWKLKSVTVPMGHPDYYTDDGSLYTTEGMLIFDSRREPPITGWAVHNWPYKMEYFIGEELDLTGMEVVLWLADGSQVTVYNGFTATGFDSAYAESYMVEVFYRDVYLGWYLVTVHPCPHEYDNGCDADCNACGAVREVPDHVYSYPCTPNCEICGVPNKNIVHSYLSDCHEVCYNCGEPRLPVADHSYDDEYDADCNVCGAVREVPVKPQVTPGDANGDGRVNNRDLGLLQQFLNEWDVSADTAAADFNGDGRINNRDLGMLQQRLNE